MSWTKLWGDMEKRMMALKIKDAAGEYGACCSFKFLVLNLSTYPLFYLSMYLPTYVLFVIFLFL